MSLKLLFCSFLFLLSCHDNKINNAGGDKLQNNALADSNYRYSSYEYNELCTKIGNKIITKADLIILFRGKYQMVTSGDSVIGFTFIINQPLEVLDTCWGTIVYDRTRKKVKDCGLVCQ